MKVNSRARRTCVGVRVPARLTFGGLWTRTPHAGIDELGHGSISL